MTLKKLSEITGYSVSTLSKVFSNSKEINQATKEEIIKKAKELGVYDKYAKATYPKRVIAVIVPEIESTFYTGIISELRKIISKKNATMVVSVTEFLESEEQSLISFYSSNKRADGIIVVNGRTVAKKYSEVPVVYIGSSKTNDYADTINADYLVGLNEAVFELKNLGHEKIAFIGESLTNRKAEKFTEAIKNNSLPLLSDLIISRKERFEEAGYRGIESLYKKKKIPTAVVCAYDYIALGVIDFLESVNLKVPDDVSVIGMDDIKIASYKKISLSSISLGINEICPIAIETLFEKIENPFNKLNKTITVKSKFIMRSSVSKARNLLT